MTNIDKKINSDETIAIDLDTYKTRKMAIENIIVDKNTKNTNQRIKIHPQENSYNEKNEPEINKILHQLIKLNATELHMYSDNPFFIRRNKRLLKLKNLPPLSPAVLYNNLKLIIPKSYIKFLSKSKNFTFPYEVKNIGRFRVNVFYDNVGICASFKKIPNKIPEMKNLNLPKSIFNIINQKEGLVIINGERRSGKSTTLNSIIQKINNEQNKHIITLETPIEFRHKSNFSLINQREVTKETFEDTFAASLLENPDIMGLGEVKTANDLLRSIRAVQEGILVFTFLNTRGIIPSIKFIENLYPRSERMKIREILSDNLLAVISQQSIITDKGIKYNYEILTINPIVSSLIKKGKKKEIANLITHHPSIFLLKQSTIC